MIARRAMRNFDVVLVLLAVALVAYGGLLLYSASLNAYPTITMDHPLTKQMIFALLGVGGMIVVAWVDYRVYGQMATGLYALAVVLLAAVLIVGDEAYGSTRWFSFAGQQIQASEVAKLLVIVSLARYLADRQRQMADPRVFVISLVMAALPAVLVLIEPDMGTAAVFGAIWLGMVAMAGAPP
ncbi:MAG: FtsW/RodA/SpoVE family cell cycle protein, partial [Chloroflexi bacterium]|nr:FtsW/RodA/SpoVE family cell cycle protein [Chloroflexota bacterium]